MADVHRRVSTHRDPSPVRVPQVTNWASTATPATVSITSLSNTGQGQSGLYTHAKVTGQGQSHIWIIYACQGHRSRSKSYLEYIHM